MLSTSCRATVASAAFVTMAFAAVLVDTSSRRISDSLYGSIGIGMTVLLLGLPFIVFAGIFLHSQSLLSVKVKNGLRVPNGSLWIPPFIGETHQVLTRYEEFLKSRIQRYGDMFTTHLFVSPTVVITNTDVLRQILASPEHKFFEVSLPTAVRTLFGPESIVNQPVGTPMHTLIRRLYLNRMKGESVSSMVTVIDQFVEDQVNTWVEKDSVTVYDEMKQATFYIALAAMCNDDLKPGSPDTEALRAQFDYILRAAFGVPINFPGTAYHAGLKAQKAIHDILDRVINARETAMEHNKDVVYDDLLGDLMSLSVPGKGSEGPRPLTRSQIRDNVLVGMIAAHDTSACATTWLLKFLAQNPKDLQEIRMEHQAIVDSKGTQNYKLAYEDILKLPASTRAFYETVRLVNPTFGVIRMASKDFELNGKLIPKGWRVMLPFRPTHQNPKYYEEGDKFNPSRFKTSAPQTSIFLPFSCGPRMCPGADLAKVESIVLLHRLVLKYRWKLMAKEGFGRVFPVPLPMKGLPIQVTRLVDNDLCKP